MKKYTLFSFVFILSLFLLGSKIANADITAVAGCNGAGPYSTTTGQLCSTTPTVPTACAPGDSFSYLTGQACPTTTTTTTTTTGPIVITNVRFSPSYPKVNDLITATVSITNSSSSDENTPFQVNVSGDAVTVASLAAGAKNTITVPNAFSFPTPGTQLISSMIIPSGGNWYGMYSKNITFTLPGCSSLSGFSTTTGISCGGTTTTTTTATPTLQLILPQDTTWTAGQTVHYKVSLTGTNVSGTFGMSLSDTMASPYNKGLITLVSTNGFSTPTNGFYEGNFTVPTLTGLSPQYVVATWYSQDGNYHLYSFANNPVSIISGTTTTTTTTSFPPGCTSNTGYSNTTGMPCDGTTSAPTVSISANPTSVNYGGSSTLTWSSTNATSCSTSLPVAASGTMNTGALTQTTTYQINCSNSYSGSSASVTVNVAPSPFLPGCTSTSGYSSIDGTSCGGITTPARPILNPINSKFNSSLLNSTL